MYGEMIVTSIQKLLLWMCIRIPISVNENPIYSCRHWNKDWKHIILLVFFLLYNHKKRKLGVSFAAIYFLIYNEFLFWQIFMPYRRCCIAIWEWNWWFIGLSVRNGLRLYTLFLVFNVFNSIFCPYIIYLPAFTMDSMNTNYLLIHYIRGF